MKHILKAMLSPANMNQAWRWFRNDRTVWQRGLRRNEMEPHRTRHILEMQAELREGRYRPDTLRRFDLRQGDGKVRELANLTLKDKIAQRALLQVIQPHFEARFHPDSFGYRPGRNTGMAAGLARTRILEGKRFLVHTDIEKFFDRVPHPLLKQTIKRRIRDRKARQLIFRWLEAHAREHARWWRCARGIPQGGILSPFLANLYLDELDWALQRRKVSFVRYADDILLLCRNPGQMRKQFRLLKRLLRKLGLSLSQRKTHLGPVRKNQRYLGQRLPHIDPRQPASRR